MQLDFSGIPILVVDDEATARMVLIKILKRIGLSGILEAEDGNSAMAATLQHRPAMVFCDVHMRPKDGLTFLAELRYHSDFKIKNTPVILVTSEERGEAVTLSQHLKVSGYLVKPPSMLAVRIAAEKALGMEF